MWRNLPSPKEYTSSQEIDLTCEFKKTEESSSDESETQTKLIVLDDEVTITKNTKKTSKRKKKSKKGGDYKQTTLTHELCSKGKDIHFVHVLSNKN